MVLAKEEAGIREVEERSSDLSALAELALEPNDKTECHTFAEALATPDALTEKLRPQLRQLVDEAITRTGNPDEQRKLRICGGILEYKFFGKPDQPLPEGLCFSRNGNSVGINYDQSADYCYHCHREAVEAIGKGLENIADGLSSWQRFTSPEIIAIADQYVRSLPSYRILKAMATAPLTRSEVVESSYWRQVREAIIRSEIEQRWGGVSIESPGAYEARQEYKRRVHNLDLEDSQAMAMQAKVTSRDGGKERLASLLKSAMGVASTRTLAVVWDQGGKRTGYQDVYVALDGELSWLSTKLSPVASKVAARLGLHGEPYLYGDIYPNQILLEEAIYGILGSHAQGGTYAGRLELAVRRAAEDLLLNEARQAADVFAIPNYKYRLQPQAATMYSDEASQVHREYHDRVDRAFKPGSINFVSLEDLTRLEREKIGRVIELPLRRRLVLDGESRLIQSIGDAPTAEFFTEGAEETLRIRLKRSFPGRPHIPGYILTSMQYDEKSRRVYGFSKDPEGDPYVRPTMHISEEARSRLADEYEAIGMTVLADAVRNSPRMNVHELSKLIQGATYYPVHFSRSRSKLPDSFTPTSLRDFAPIIKNRRLWAQCNGSAPFLALSLQLCGFEAGVVTGRRVSLALPLIRKIKAAPHAQTYINHDGRRYIVDATGNLTAFNELKKIAVGAYTRVRDSVTAIRNVGKIAKMARAPLASRAPDPLPIPHRPTSADTKTPAEITAHTQEVRRKISQALSDTLAPMFGASSGETLIKALSKVMDISAAFKNRNLPGDPVLRTITIARRAANGNATQAQIDSLERYLRGYKNHPAKVKKLGLPQYNPGLLDVLIGFADQIKAA